MLVLGQNRFSRLDDETKLRRESELLNPNRNKSLDDDLEYFEKDSIFRFWYRMYMQIPLESIDVPSYKDTIPYFDEFEAKIKSGYYSKNFKQFRSDMIPFLMAENTVDERSCINVFDHYWEICKSGRLDLLNSFYQIWNRADIIGDYEYEREDLRKTKIQ